MEPASLALRPGLVSITFRHLAPREVLEWAVRAGLEGVEWGGDLHVPHGDLAAAREVGNLTRAAGLEVAAYGSYYRAGHAPEEFPAVLETARQLGAPILRVWGGRQGSPEADSAYRAQVAADCRRISERAAAAGIRIACEWHGNTLTDTAASARDLFQAVDHPNFRTYWQPRRQQPAAACRQDLRAALPRLAGIHVFQWDEETGARQPLAEGERAWRSYLEGLAGAGAMFALLEFVRDDDPEQMLRDAATLRGWLGAG